MTFELTLRELPGDRVVAEAEFPVSIGGPGATIVIPSLDEGAQAWLGLHDGQLFVQAAHDDAPVLHNGLRVAGSVWMRAGDVLDLGPGRVKLRQQETRWELEVVDGAAGNVTAPPLVDAETPVGGTAGDQEHLEPLAFRRHAQTAPATRPRLPWRGLAIAAGLAALALLATLIFTSVPVQVAIEPQPEHLAFEGGWPTLRLGSSFLVRPGKYELVARRSGYASLRLPVEITAERDQRIERRLALLPGILQVELQVAGAVRIDGADAGTAPGRFELQAGRHSLLIDTERYQDYLAEVVIEGGGKVQTLNPQLAPGWGEVSIRSEPADVEVLVGGESRGRTPLEFELMAGNHPIELRRAGYKTWVSDINVKAATPLAIGPVRLGVPDGRLFVRSAPAGASVTVGGVYRGRTPLQFEVRPDVPQRLAVSRDGYESASREVSIASGAQESVEVSLKPILGDVTVRATPADADLFIDGRASGKANQTLRLPSTAHLLEIRKAGYAPHRVSVTPRPNLPQNVEVTLLEGVLPSVPAVAAVAGAAPGSAAAGAGTATPAVIALTPGARTRTGIEMKLVPAGTFTMGSPRREAGRRANESQRPVQLNRRFYVSLREISNAEFRQFKPEHRSGFVGQTTMDLDRQPVVNVGWQEAAAFCNWLSSQEGLPAAYVSDGGRLMPAVPATTGYRLPSEAEWEWIARSSGGALRKYPWGDSLPVPAGAGNYADRTAQPLVPLVLADLDDGHPASAPVGSFAPNPLGFFDLGGNVSEWTQDVYTVQPPASAAAIDPLASGAGGVHVIRGSSWKHSAVTELRLAYRDYGDARRNDLGFRIARYAQ